MKTNFIILLFLMYMQSLCAHNKECSIISVKEHTGELTPYFLKTMHDLFSASTFVETGTFLGDTTAFAAEIFDKVYTVELSPEIYQKATNYLKDYKNIRRYLGDSKIIFNEILPGIKQPVIFWLDAHYSGHMLGHQTALGTETSAIMHELREIKKAKLDNSIIMVDDIRLFDAAFKDLEDKSLGGCPSLDELLTEIYALNKDYQVLFLGDILLAYPNTFTINFSPIIKSMTKSILADQTNTVISLQEILEAEKIISRASGSELKYIVTLFERFTGCEITDKFGIGKQFMLWRALIALEAKQYLQAYHWFEIVAKYSPQKNGRILWYMAQAAYGAGYKELAYKLLLDVLKKLPDFKEARQLLSDLKKQKITKNLALKPYDLTIAGVIQFGDSLGRLAVSAIEMLNGSLKMNYIISRSDGFIDYDDLSQDIIKTALNPDKTPGNVALFFDLPLLSWENPVNFLPKSPIKIAYTMVESTAVPPAWIQILNEKFDAIAVPDISLIEVYEKSGIKIPIFELPCALYLEDFLAEPIKKNKNTPFIFGLSAGYWERKNHMRVLEAFAEEFGNNSNVRLKIHSRIGEPAIRGKIEEFIKKNNLTNVDIIDQRLSKDEYKKLFKSFDCYILLSKGEGFSITPREALALGIPCILSNNTAHKKICATGLVKCVETPFQIKANYSHVSQDVEAGFDFDCTTIEARKAMTDVYENYDNYLKNGPAGREWAKQYLIENLKNYYTTLVKPNKIKLGSSNSLANNTLTTNDKSLYNKYKKIAQ